MVSTGKRQDKYLANRVIELGEFFDDMLFNVGSSTQDFVMCKMKMSGESDWIDSPVWLPDDLEYFDYCCFLYSVREFDDPDTTGRFNCAEQELSISPFHLNNDAVILHEMIHLHEYVINELPLFYHDAIFVSLYNNLLNKIPDLPQRIPRLAVSRDPRRHHDVGALERSAA